MDADFAPTGGSSRNFRALGGAGERAVAWLKVLDGQMGLVRLWPGWGRPWCMAPEIIWGDRWRKMSHGWAGILQRSSRRSTTAGVQPAAWFRGLVLLLGPV